LLLWVCLAGAIAASIEAFRAILPLGYAVAIGDVCSGRSASGQVQAA
jgi:hypothetical protein